MAAEGQDGFEEELVVRLGARAGAVDARPPLAGLREAGRRRARRLTVVRGVAAAAALALGVGALTQLGGGGGTAEAAHPVGIPTGGPGATSPSSGPWGGGGVGRLVLSCTNGPTALRTPGFHPPTARPTWTGTPSWLASGLPSSGFPPSGLPSSGGPSSGLPSSGGPFTGVPSGLPSSGVPSSGMTFTGGTLPRTGPTSFSGSPSPLSEAQLRHQEVVREANSVAAAGDHFPDVYFGTCFDSATATVYLIRLPGTGLDAAATQALGDRPSVRLQFVDAVGSRTELQALADRIRADSGSWQAKGVEIRFVSVANDGAGVVVDCPQWESAGAEIKARYGPKVVEVR
ncbi:hypothetical protein [Kitasatospora sp. NPDC097643]|uniref:hypothetical protein n=1 Tax=Kitasatospora sp. NPDC097643 TaxID=3157230 RepID=UPI0033349F67